MDESEAPLLVLMSGSETFHSRVGWSTLRGISGDGSSSVSRSDTISASVKVWSMMHSIIADREHFQMKIILMGVGKCNVKLFRNWTPNK